MAENKIVSQQPQGEKSFWQALSIWQKIILFIIILTFVFLGWVFLFGGINSLWELIFVILLVIVLFLITYFIIFAGQFIFKERYYSPKEDYFTRVINTAIDFKPSNVNNIYFEGDNDHKLVYGGQIKGMLGIPYFVGDPELDKDGQWIYYESKLLKKKIPKFKNIVWGKEGDTLFIYDKGWFIFKRRHFLRCNRELHGDLHGDVAIKDINPVPFGKFFEYPFKQLQKDIGKIMLQSQLEVILATHEHQGDLISQASDAGTYYNPYFRMIKEQSAEISREGS